MSDNNNRFSLKILLIWLFVLAILRTAIQSIMKIANGEGEQFFHQLKSLELTYNQSAALSIFILIILSVYYFLKRNRS